MSYFLGDDGFENLFFFCSRLQLKKDKGIDYAISSKSEGVYSYILSPQYIAFLYNIKLFRYKMGIKFDKDLLAAE